MEPIAHARQLFARLIDLETSCEDDQQLELEGAISGDELDRRFSRCCDQRHVAEEAIVQTIPTLLPKLPADHVSALRGFLAAHAATQRDDDFHMSLEHERQRALEATSVGLEVPGAAELHGRRERGRLAREARWALAATLRASQRRQSGAHALELSDRRSPGDFLYPVD